MPGNCEASWLSEASDVVGPKEEQNTVLNQLPIWS